MEWYGEGTGTPLQYSCLENPMDGGAWWAAVHGVTKSRTQLSDFTFTFHFHALEKEMATHSRVLAWRIRGMGEPGGLPSMGSHRVGHDWSDLAAAAVEWYTYIYIYIYVYIYIWFNKYNDLKIRSILQQAKRNSKGTKKENGTKKNEVDPTYFEKIKKEWTRERLAEEKLPRHITNHSGFYKSFLANVFLIGQFLSTPVSKDCPKQPFWDI